MTRIVTFARRRHLLFWGFWAIVIVGPIVWAVLLPPPSPEEQQAIAQARQQSAQEHDYAAKQLAAERAAAAAIDTREAKLCRTKRVCSTYAKARQECATAGNFGLCVDVKMGRQDFSPAYVCTDDGEIAAPPMDHAEPSSLLLS